MRALLIAFATTLCLAASAAADELLVAIKKAPVLKSTQDPVTIAEIEVGQVVTAISCTASLCKISKPVLGYVMKKRFARWQGEAIPCVQLSGKRC
jgi:hypothetical protein